MRKRFKLTEEQFQRLVDAARPVPYLIVNGIGPRSPQENANDAWCVLGRELGFDGMSVRPDPEGAMFFTAEVTSQPSVMS